MKVVDEFLDVTMFRLPLVKVTHAFDGENFLKLLLTPKLWCPVVG